jgi:hypothetical protein
MELIRRHNIIASAAFCALGVAVLFVCAVQIEKYTFHRRAVRLASTVASLEVGSSTFEQAQQSFKQWKSKEVDANCSPTACSYSVVVYPPILSTFAGRFSRVDQDDDRRRIYWIYALAGGASASVRVGVDVGDGKVSSKSVTISIVVPRDKLNPYEQERWVMGSSYVGPQRNRGAERPDQDMRQELLHPEYLVSRGVGHPNLDTGGGYTSLYVGRPFRHPQTLPMCSDFRAST